MIKIVLLILTSTWIYAMDYYSFEIDGEKCGYYQVEDEGGIFASNAFIEMDGVKFENPFWVKYDKNKVTDYRFGDSEKWESLANFDANVYPSAAIDILARRLSDGQSLVYDLLTEGNKKIKRGVKLIKTGDKVSEIIDDKPGRYLIYDKSGKIMEYGWGGTAKSQLVKDRDEAVKGTNFK